MATFTDRSKVVLLLWFTIYVIVCLCMYVLVIFILDSRLAILWKEIASFFLFGVFERKLLSNCIDS